MFLLLIITGLRHNYFSKISDQWRFVYLNVHFYSNYFSYAPVSLTIALLIFAVRHVIHHSTDPS